MFSVSRYDDKEEDQTSQEIIPIAEQIRQRKLKKQQLAFTKRELVEEAEKELDIEDSEKPETTDIKPGFLPINKEPSSIDNAIKNRLYNSGLVPLNEAVEEEEITNEKKRFKESKLGLPEWLANPDVISSAIIPSKQSAIDNFPLNPKLLENCHEEGIRNFFPAQVAVLSHFLNPERNPFLKSLRTHPGDLCISAPTGSGKTLSYILPMIHHLAGRQVVRLRGLILVPSRVLTKQVKECLDIFKKGTSIKVAMIDYFTPIEKERLKLVGFTEPILCGGSSNIDILVCTPGGLFRHLNKTPNFTLQHLQFLVMDEADRLIDDVAAQDWLSKILLAIKTPPKVPNSQTLSNFDGQLRHDAITSYFNKEDPLGLFSSRQNQVQKLLFSATLTRNPGKIASLQLVQPKLISVKGDSKSFVTIPASLEESFVVTTLNVKPLVLIELLKKHKFKNVIIFANSVEASVRLEALLKIYFEDTDVEYFSKLSLANFSSKLSMKERKVILKAFKANEIQLLICTDIMSRGMDFDEIDAVINYDAPTNIQTYIHRVGRTARKGLKGQAITLVTTKEERYFMSIHEDENRTHLLLNNSDIYDQDFKHLMPHYEKSLKKLGRQLQG